MLGDALTRWLERAPRGVFALYAAAVAFATYFGMYAFRKPFAAASFEGETFLASGVALKTAFVIAQLVGYTLSKYVGVGVAPSLPDGRRARALVTLVLASELALLLFAVLPGDLKVVAIFANGLPLGMVWGIVVRYLEGRRTSDALLAGLATSFIVASGVVKDAGRWLMREGDVSEAWMPFATGAVFLPGFLLAVWLLDRLPPPTADDVASRSARPPMDAAMRRAFLRDHGAALAPLLVVYVAVTAYRDFRDNYGVELFDELGYGAAPAIFTETEVPVALGVLVSLALLGLVRRHRAGLFATYALMSAGAALIGGSTWLLSHGGIDGATWMLVTGLGSYLVYVPYNTVLFERFVAVTGVAGNAVFAIQLADALGYTGSVVVQLVKDLGAADATRLAFFRGFSSVVAALALALFALSAARMARTIPAAADPAP
ncbi:MAG: hypothetical protein KF901_30495 [Myxococcales bacterium]|nr:hypothetical protein [Myxococcales bacterium]